MSVPFVVLRKVWAVVLRAVIFAAAPGAALAAKSGVRWNDTVELIASLR
jgi:ABC-type transporter Mla maintaining outer membrane lipid asymmetry permease subunit MlaE